MSTTVQITDNVSPAMAAFQTPDVELTLRAPVGDALVRLFQTHFIALGPNKNGWPTTHFWARAAAATSYDLTSDGMTINVDQVGVRQRFQGGPIFPTGDHKFLTIPACAEACGKRARDFSDLKFARIFTSDDRGLALVEAGSPAAATGASTDGVMFWLARSVHQDPDPDILPDDDEIRETVTQAITRQLIA